MTGAIKILNFIMILAAAVLLLWAYPAYIYTLYQSGLEKDCEAMGQSRTAKFTVRCEVIKKAQQ